MSSRDTALLLEPAIAMLSFEKGNPVSGISATPSVLLCCLFLLLGVIVVYFYLPISSASQRIPGPGASEVAPYSEAAGSN